MGPRFVRFAAVFYGLLVVAAAVWSGLRGMDLPVLGPRPATGFLLGLATAAGTVSMSLLAYRLVPITRKLAEELAPVLVDGTDRAGLVLLAVFSGVGEEVFFRGFIFAGFRQRYGWQKAALISSAIFGVLHLQLLAIPLLSLLGYIFAYLYHRTNSIWLPILLHFLVNTFAVIGEFVLDID